MWESSPQDLSSLSACGDSSTQTQQANPSELVAQRPLLRMESLHPSYRPSADGPLMLGRFTSEKTLSLSRRYYLAKPHALHPHTSTLWTPDNFLAFFFSLLTASFPLYRLSYPQRSRLLHHYIQHERFNTNVSFSLTRTFQHACTLLFALPPHIARYAISSELLFFFFSFSYIGL